MNAPRSQPRLDVGQALREGWQAFNRAPWLFVGFTLLLTALQLVLQHNVARTWRSVAALLNILSQLCCSSCFTALQLVLQHNLARTPCQALRLLFQEEKRLLLQERLLRRFRCQYLHFC